MNLFRNALHDFFFFWIINFVCKNTGQCFLCADTYRTNMVLLFNLVFFCLKHVLVAPTVYLFFSSFAFQFFTLFCSSKDWDFLCLAKITERRESVLVILTFNHFPRLFDVIFSCKAKLQIYEESRVTVGGEVVTLNQLSYGENCLQTFFETVCSTLFKKRYETLFMENVYIYIYSSEIHFKNKLGGKRGN